MMALTTKAHHLQTEAQQEAEHELEALELTTARVHVCEGLEGGFISFDQHALIASTIYKSLVDIWHIFNKRVSKSLLCGNGDILNSLHPHTPHHASATPVTASTVSTRVRYGLLNTRR
jgi:hypothetical protein